MLGRGRSHPAPVESGALRREREAIERLRAEVGARLEEVKRRELALEKRLARLEDGAGEPDPEILRGLEERSLALDGRERELAEREAALTERERALLDREAVAEGPAELERVLAEIDRRQEELARAEQLFLRTRQELLERSEAIAAKEEELLQWERELERGGASGFFLPPVADGEDEDDEPARLRRPSPEGPSFSGGLRELQVRGARRRRRRGS